MVAFDGVGCYFVCFVPRIVVICYYFEFIRLVDLGSSLGWSLWVVLFVLRLMEGLCVVYLIGCLLVCYRCLWIIFFRCVWMFGNVCYLLFAGFVVFGLLVLFVVLGFTLLCVGLGWWFWVRVGGGFECGFALFGCMRCFW